MLRILYFGMSGLFSRLPLEYLLEQSVEICGVIMPAEPGTAQKVPQLLEPPSADSSDSLLLMQPVQQTILHGAWQHNIPVWTVGSLSSPATLTLFSDLSPDLICVVCFPEIFPPALLDIPQFGCLNLHPSCLPAYRGPTPLFWIFRRGETETGVTLHMLDQGIDSGDIVAQTRFSLPDGMTEYALTALCASQGARLLFDAISQLNHGPLSCHPQLQANSSYYPAPTSSDMVVPTSWPARRAFNFLRGANTWPLVIPIGTERLRVSKALGYENQTTLSAPYVKANGSYLVQFDPGVVEVLAIIQQNL